METGNDLTFDERDSAMFMPKARVIDSAFTWGADRPLRTAFDQSLVYELHVRGFTKMNPNVPERLRGTFRGLVQPDVIRHIKSLGVTAVELMPIHMFINDDHLLQNGLTNYWGYNTLGFFAPDRRFASVYDFAFSEFKEMVNHFHDNDLEVILDVVYNHTAEGNEKGPTFSFKGIDNYSYYRLLREKPRYYVNDTGTGNTLNLSHPRVCSRWSRTVCAIGCKTCTSTASGSTLAPSSPERITASTKAAASSTLAGRTRSCPPSN